MRVLVTGGAGFIGQHIVRMLVERGDVARVMLAEGESARPLDGLGAELVRADLRDLPAVRDAVDGCDAVVHAAAIYKLWMRDYRPMYQVNVQGTRNVLEACRSVGVGKVVHTSSIAAIGVEPGTRPATEDSEFNQHGRASHYILSKHMAERAALEYVDQGVPVTIVNPSFPLGVGDHRPTPTGRIVLRILVGSYFGYGPGGLNIVDVEDVARGHLLALEHGEVGRRYLLSGTDVTQEGLFAAVSRVGGVRRRGVRLPRWLMLGMGYLGDGIARWREPLIDSVTVKYSSQHLFFDCARAQAELGYTVTPLDDAMDKSIRWFRDNGYLQRGASWRMRLLGGR